VGFGLLAGVVEAEARMAAGEWSTAAATVGEGERTQGRAVLWANRGHGCLLRLNFGLLMERAGLKPGTYNFDSKQEYRQDCLRYKKGKATLRPRRNTIEKNYTGIVMSSSRRE
jgi:hypothetical protein